MTNLLERCKVCGHGKYIDIPCKHCTPPKESPKDQMSRVLTAHHKPYKRPTAKITPKPTYSHKDIMKKDWGKNYCKVCDCFEPNHICKK